MVTHVGGESRAAGRNSTALGILQVEAEADQKVAQAIEEGRAAQAEAHQPGRAIGQPPAQPSAPAHKPAEPSRASRGAGLSSRRPCPAWRNSSARRLAVMALAKRKNQL